jgi:pimeloyl-ACP methyl ester carboxylesterase
MRAFFAQREQAFVRYVDLPGLLPASVFIHGALDSSIAGMAMTAAQRGLRDRRRVLIDLLGYGMSDRPKEAEYSLQRHAQVVADLLDHLGIERCQLVGHSMGGAVVVMVASERPDLVCDLVLAEGKLSDGPEGFSSFAEGRSEEEYVQDWYPNFIASRLEDATTEAGVLAIHLGMAQAAAPWAVYRTSQSLNVDSLQPSLRERFLSLDMPRAYFVGANSEPDEDDLPLKDELMQRGGDWVVVPDAEHQMNFDNPEGFADAIARRVRAH